MAQTAVVILNWNGHHHLSQFLPSVIQYSADAHIYVVDNNSTDGSVAFLQKHFGQQIKIIQHKKNEGFCKGYNLALGEIDADYYVLLNSDVEVTKGWLRCMVSFMNCHPLTAACQPKIKSYLEKEKFEYAGAAGGYIDKLGFPFCRGRVFSSIETDHGQYDDDAEIFWATGACLMVRAEVYHKLGGLDSNFFAHMEEIDLCWRFKNAGYAVRYCGGSEVFHLGGGTLNKSNPQKTYLNFRNGLFLLYKNLPSNKLFSTIFIRMALDGVAAWKFLFADSPAHFFAVFRAHLSFYSSLARLSSQRKKMLKTNVVNNHRELKIPSIAWQYFIRKRKFFNEILWK